MNPRTGRSWLEATNEGVGFGGTRGDGESGIMPVTEPGCRNNPVEVLETKSPMLIEHYGLRPDSGGLGLHRGGLGVSSSFRFLADSTSAIMVYKTRTRPWAIGGGPSGENNHIIMNPGTPEERMAGGHYQFVNDGDALVNNSGGGGWCDPLVRDRARVLEDVRYGYVSVQAARDTCGVDLDVDRWAVSEKETARLRPRAEQRPEPTPVGRDTLRPRPAVTATP